MSVLVSARDRVDPCCTITLLRGSYKSLYVTTTIFEDQRPVHPMNRLPCTIVKHQVLFDLL